MSSTTSFALNNACTATVNFDPFFGFHSYTLEGKSVLLSKMEECDLRIIREVLQNRYSFYKTARELVEHIDKLVNEMKEKSAPKEVCKYKQLLNETFGISFEEMVGKEIASRQLVEETCRCIKALPDFANWKTTTGSINKENEVGNILLEFEFKSSEDYVYAKLVKCGDTYDIHTRSNGNKMTWNSIQCATILDALNYVARRFW